MNKLTFSAGPALTTAGKTLACAPVSGGYNCLASGMNGTPIAGGVVAAVSVNTSPTFAGTTINVASPAGSSGSGAAVPVTGTGSVLSLLAASGPVLSALACNPTSFAGAGTAVCSATISGSAPSAGVTVTLASNSSYVTVPTSVKVPSGATTVAFNAAVLAVPANQTPVISAAAGGVSKTAAFTLTASSTAISALTCANLSFTAAGSTLCTVTLTAKAPATGMTVGLYSASAAVAVPASVMVAGGALSGTFTATIKAFNAYQLVMVSASTGVIAKSLYITLSPTLAKPAVTFTANPTTVAKGATSTLNWSVTGATTVTIDQGIGTVAATGTRSVTPAATTAYLLTATNTAGATTASASVTVSAKPAVTFSANPTDIAPGGTATLTWSVTGASSVTIDQGIGVVAASGTRSMKPAATTTYLLTATSSAGNTTASASITLKPVQTTKNYDVDFATYLGGSNWEHARDITTDTAGNIYMVGGTQSGNFNHTIGQAYAGSVDAFIVKLSPAGKLIWSELLGGPNYDRAYAVKVDKAGNIYVTGRAGRGFPVKSAFQSTFNGYNTGSTYGDQNAFVAKLNSQGAVLWATYVGTGDLHRDLDIDAKGDIYVVGNYQPALGQAAFPSAWFANAYQKTPLGGQDLTIIKLATSGSGVVWATYLGGSNNEDHKGSIRLDPAGNLFILTDTASTNMPVPGGYQTTNHGQGDAYLAKMKSDGTGLLWATYFGGSGQEINETHHLAVDLSGNAYIAVSTQSTDAPTTAGAYQRTFGGVGVTHNHAVGDALVAKFAPNGTLLASTYVGGADGDGPQGLAVDAAGNVYFSGGTVSADFPVTSNAAQLHKAAGEEAMAVRLRADFSAIDYATFIGSAGDDEGRTVYADAAGNIYVGVEMAGSTSIIKNAIQGLFGGGSADVVLIKLKPMP